MGSAGMKQIWVLLLMVLLVMAAGCSGKHKMVAGAPDWVNEGSGAFEDNGDSVFYGVGSVTGSRAGSRGRIRRSPAAADSSRNFASRPASARIRLSSKSSTSMVP